MLLLNLRNLIVDNPAKRDKFLLWSFLLSLLLNVGLWIYLLLRFWNFSEYVILDYDIYFGINLLGPWYQILILPALGLLALLVNFLLAFYVYLKNNLISYGLAVTVIGLNLILVIVGVFLGFIN